MISHGKNGSLPSWYDIYVWDMYLAFLLEIRSCIPCKVSVGVSKPTGQKKNTQLANQNLADSTFDFSSPPKHPEATDDNKVSPQKKSEPSNSTSRLSGLNFRWQARTDHKSSHYWLNTGINVLDLGISGVNTLSIPVGLHHYGYVHIWLQTGSWTDPLHDTGESGMKEPIVHTNKTWVSGIQLHKGRVSHVSSQGISQGFRIGGWNCQHLLIGRKRRINPTKERKGGGGGRKVNQANV